MSGFFIDTAEPPAPAAPEPDLSWFYVAIDHHRIGYVLAAASGFWETDIFPSPDAEECGIYIPAEILDRAGLYRVTEVRMAYSGDIEDDIETSGRWEALHVIAETNHGG